MFPPRCTNLGLSRWGSPLFLWRIFGIHAKKIYMNAQFQANATIISLLHDHNRNAYANYEKLVQQYRALWDAQYYLETLVETIEAYPILMLEWDNFRELAGLSPYPSEARSPRPRYDRFLDESPVCQHTLPVLVGDRATDRHLLTQETLIANLKEKAATYQSGIERVTDRIAAATAARYYLHMQHRIQDDPQILDAWKTFLMLITLTVDGPIQGITCDDHSRRHC